MHGIQDTTLSARRRMTPALNSPRRLKPYKACDPEATVAGISKILESAGLSFCEDVMDENPFFKACSLSIINPRNKLTVFRSYGKGTTTAWARASAWGEMIERIANMAFYTQLIFPSCMDQISLEGDAFHTFPDEKLISPHDTLWRVTAKKFENLLPDDSLLSENVQKILTLPFCNVFNRTVEYLPFRAIHVIAGSNGMCSGNTRDEALIQGISEIYERFVLKSIYLHPFCPPDIPLYLFEGTEIAQKMAQLADEFNLTIQIKDCSMGKSYPVLGILIRKAPDSYAFHLGADPCPVTALERCFTEMFQGGSICFQSIGTLNQNRPYNAGTVFWKKNIDLTIKAYAGQWPHELLGDDADYLFNGFDHPESVSDSDDLYYLMRLLQNEGRQLYIRDNSFLGQPAYYIYIPGMSEMMSFPDPDFSTRYLAFDRFIPTLLNLNRSKKNNRKDMLELMLRYKAASPVEQFTAGEYFRFFPSHPVARLPSEDLISLIRFSLLEGYLSDHFSEEEMKANFFLESFRKTDSMVKPDQVFQVTGLPDCFNCDHCTFSEECHLPYVTFVWEKIRKKMSSNFIDQINSLNFGDV
jgi:ribosomal protein S12 methylthiotransferase accessory factor